MKKIVVIYFSDDWKKKIPIKNELTRKAFQDWHERGEEKNIGLFRASIKWYDSKKNVFRKAWAFRDGKWIKIKKPFKPDLIYDKICSKRDYELFEKKIKIAQKVKVLNNPIFRTITDNKIAQYMLFREYMPDSFIVSNKKELDSALNKISSKKAVVKPLYGSGGFGIIIDEKKKIKKTSFIYPVLVQEFIISNKGIPGFSKKREISDLRLVFMSHKLRYALSRIAKKGSLFTNLHQGASGVMVPKDKIPKSINNMVKNIIKRLSVFPYAQYSLDFVFADSGRPYLIEMNTTPGVDLITVLGDEKIKRENFEDFIKELPKSY